MQSLWMLFATFMFAIMGVCVKLASEMYSISEIVMYRGVIGISIMLPMILYQGGSFKTTMPGAHLWRGTVGVIALWLWFYAIAALPLATAMTINYMAPIWIALILFCAGWWHSKNHVEWPLLAAIGTSFIGVTLLLQPAFEAKQLAGALTALASGMLSALAYLQVRKLGLLGEPEYRVVFYFTVVNLLAGVFGHIASAGSGPVVWHAHDSNYGIALLVVIGICATMAQMAMTRAYRLGKTLVVANLQYTGIIFSSAWGVLIFKDQLHWYSWAGIALILGSGIAATYYNTLSTARGAAIKTTDPIASEV